jgi:hypothetical protein
LTTTYFDACFRGSGGSTIVPRKVFFMVYGSNVVAGSNVTSPDGGTIGGGTVSGGNLPSYKPSAV